MLSKIILGKAQRAIWLGLFHNLQKVIRRNLFKKRKYRFEINDKRMALRSTFAASQYLKFKRLPKRSLWRSVIFHLRFLRLVQKPLNRISSALKILFGMSI